MPGTGGTRDYLDSSEATPIRSRISFLPEEFPMSGVDKSDSDEMEFHEGEWFVVREGTAYEIETRTGYTALAGYKMACKTQH